MIKKKPINTIIFAASLLVFLFSGCVKSSVPNTSSTTGNTLLDLIKNASNLTILDSAISKAGEDTLLADSGIFTCFVATDAACQAAGVTLSLIGSQPDSVVKKWLLYQIVPQGILSNQLPTGPDAPITTLSGDSIFVTNDGVGLFVNGIEIVSPDALAANGVIDALESPLVPPTGNLLQFAESDTAFSYFVAAVNRTSTATVNIANLLSGGNIYTLLLASDSAFQAAGYASINAINNANPDSLSAMLQYNILPKRLFTPDFESLQVQQTLDGSATINIVQGSLTGFTVLGKKNSTYATVLVPNIMAHNGVIHVMNQLLLP